MTDSKIDVLNVQTNVHITLRLLREGKFGYVPFYRAYESRETGRIESYQDSELKRTLHARNWHADLQRRFPLHPAVDKMLGMYRPKDWQQLVLEFPHQAETDRNRIAYTQNEEKGKRDLQTVTTLGKYLTRHFPHVADHEIRNTVASYSVGGCKLLHTTAEMIQALMSGPNSCMTNNWRGSDLNDHPYKVYDPRLGWGLAVRVEDGEVIGRALVYEHGDIKQFVRTYLRPSDSSAYSQADDQLNAWLRDQGYMHASDWEGCYMRYYRSSSRSDAPLAPYLDGGVKDVKVVERDGEKLLLVDCDGEWHFESQDGRCTDNEGADTCNDCGDRIDDGDGYWVGADEDEIVCQHCCDHNYYYGYGRRGRQYYIHESNIVSVGDYTYDDAYLGDNDIVCLHDGEYAHSDNAVYVESESEYYEADDEAVCYDDYNSQYELRDNCVELNDGSMCHQDDAWQCEESNEWYSDADLDDSVEVDGKRYHKDNVPETDEETTETTGE